MIFIFFLIIIFASVVVFFILSNKNASQRRQIMMFSKQVTDLRNKLNNNNITNAYPKSLTVKFKTPSINKAVTIKKCFLYIAPIESSSILTVIEINAQLDVHDSADIFGLVWYEVTIPSIDRINNKGWIKSTDVNIFTTDK
ncbi:MAG: hypothetical protein Q8900_11530 [Bacillota bacterium]|nr:hypothetical protein [Bacillota bacterium]